MKRWMAAVIPLLWASWAQAGDPWRGQWIWDTPAARTEVQTPEPRYFRKTVTLEAAVNQNHTLILADDRFRLYVNGQEALTGTGWSIPTEADLTQRLRPGRNVIAIEAANAGGPAGLYFESNLKNQRGEMIHIVSDAGWRVSLNAAEGWTQADFDDSRWKPAAALGPIGTLPWGKLKKPADAPARPAIQDPLPAAESITRFTVPDGFEVRLVAEEPDIINPVAMAVDEQGRLFVAESHTYRWGKDAAPVSPPTNPIVMLEIGQDGRARRKTVVAQGYEDPVMGLIARDGKLWISALNQLLVADIRPDGTAGPQKLLVRDVARPWNPFGFYRIAFGPDGWLYLIVGDHEIELIDADDRHIKTRGSTGALFRCRPDGTKLELLTQGMRAPFSFDFDPYGHIWVLSNGEGNPNRLLMMIPGLDYHYKTRHGDWGWLAGTHPWSPPVTEMERGANTQVLCYLDAAYPASYWGRLLVANWGAHGFASINHKIDLYTPDERGNITGVSVFLDSTDPRFRPTQLLPDADGNLYMVDWYGKDDENDLTGRIYRIVYTGNERRYTPARAVLSATHDLSGEQSTAIQDLFSPRSLVRERAADTLCATASSSLTSVLGRLLTTQPDAFAASRLVWPLARLGTPGAVAALIDGTQHPSPLIRAMCVRVLRELNIDLTRARTKLKDERDPEVLVELALSWKEPDPVVSHLLAAMKAGAGADRRLRYQCAAELSRRMPAGQFGNLIVQPGASPDPILSLTGWIALDIALLENTNPDARKVFRHLLEQPAHAEHTLMLAERWIQPDDTPFLRNLLTSELDSGGSAAHLAAAFRLLQRLGPEALGSMSAEVKANLFERLLGGQIPLPGPADRLGVLRLVEAADTGPAGAAFVTASLSDPDAGVRLAALQTVRRIGWQYPDLFASVWSRLDGAGGSLDERLSAITALGAQEKPEAGRWKRLIESDDVIVTRAALRTCKQFAGDESIRAMLRELTPGLISRRPDLTTELAAVLNLFELDVSTPTGPPPIPPSRLGSDDIQRRMLERLTRSSPRLGQDVFERAGCAACHDVNGQTQTFGPALKDIGKAATPASLAESILMPGKTIKDGFEMQFVRTQAGQELEGWVEQHGNDLIVVRGGAERIRLSGDQVVERRKLDTSPMPEMSLDGVSIDELSDLLAYLVSQGGKLEAAPATAPAQSASTGERQVRRSGQVTAAGR